MLSDDFFDTLTFLLRAGAADCVYSFAPTTPILSRPPPASILRSYSSLAGFTVLSPILNHTQIGSRPQLCPFSFGRRRTSANLY